MEQDVIYQRGVLEMLPLSVIAKDYNSFNRQLREIKLTTKLCYWTAESVRGGGQGRRCSIPFLFAEERVCLSSNENVFSFQTKIISFFLVTFRSE